LNDFDGVVLVEAETDVETDINATTKREIIRVPTLAVDFTSSGYFPNFLANSSIASSPDSALV
jgi:aspartyl aminopeptidase